MKLYILKQHGSDNPRNGFLNLVSNPSTQYDPEVMKNLNPECTKLVPGSLDNLKDLIPNGLLEEIILSSPLNIIDPPSFVGILQVFKQKLKEDGKLCINFIEINRVAQGISTSNLDLQGIHTLTIGSNFEYKSILDMSVVRTLLEKIGFIIDSVSFENEYFGVIHAINGKS